MVSVGSSGGGRQGPEGSQSPPLGSNREVR